MKNIVYGLKDPRNDVYCYIGKSTVGEKRALSHLTKSHSKKVQEWVSELEGGFLYPKVEIIEEVEDLNDLAGRELYWIDYYHSINPNLLNIQLVNSNLVDLRDDEDEQKFNLLCHSIVNMHEVLKNERMYRKITQQELSDIMGVSRSTLSLLENGENVTISVIKNYILSLKGFDIKTKVLNKRVRSN